MQDQDFPFLSDILSQPKGLEDVVNGYDPAQMDSLREKLAGGAFDRVIITGMGASTFATYPAWLLLAQAGIPAYWMDTSELLAYAPGMVTPRTLLWVVSNSGKSIEITRLLNRLAEFGSPFVLANSNDPESPLAQRANQMVPMYTGPDLTLSTRSYIGTLAVTQLMALNLLGRDVTGEVEDLRFTVDGLREYVDAVAVHLEKLDEQVGKVEHLAIVGRGPSYATATEGALCFKEGPKINAEGLTTGQFWHGPVELADEHLTLVALGGEPATRKEDEFMANKAAAIGARVFWLCEQPSAELATLEMPKYRGIGLTAAEILPLQLMSINIGKQSGFRPGDFRHLGKAVTTKQEMFEG